MIFGRTRAQKSWIPMGTFLVRFDWPEGTPYPLTLAEGMIVAADTHEQAERRADDIIAFLQGEKLPRCKVGVIDVDRPIRTEIPNGTYIAQSAWTPTSSPVVKNCYGWLVLADSKDEAAQRQHDIVTALQKVARAQRRFEKQRPRR